MAVSALARVPCQLWPRLSRMKCFWDKWLGKTISLKTMQIFEAVWKLQTAGDCKFIRESPEHMSRAEHTALHCASAICKPPLLSTHPHLLWPVFTHIPTFWCWELPTCLGNYSVALSVQLILQHPSGVGDIWEGDISFNPEHCGK